jgi:hypothetical protein
MGCKRGNKVVHIDCFVVFFLLFVEFEVFSYGDNAEGVCVCGRIEFLTQLLNVGMDSAEQFEIFAKILSMLSSVLWMNHGMHSFMI